MCVQAIPLLLSAAGTAVSQNAQNRASDEAARAAGQRARTADEFNRQAGSRVSEEVQRLKSSTAEGEEQTAEKSFMDAIRQAAMREGGSTSEPRGNVSDRFSSDQAVASTAAQVGNRNASRSLARIDAPFLQRVREGAGAQRTGSDLSLIENAAGGQDFLQQLRASLISPNAGQMAIGDLASSYGSAAAKRAPKPRLSNYSPQPLPPAKLPGGF